MEMRPITNDSLKKMVILAGLKYKLLAEKAMAENLSLKTLITMTSKSNIEALQIGRSSTDYSIKDTDTEEQEGGEMEARENHLRAQLEELQVCKLRKAGRYSGRYKEPEKWKCGKCTYEHKEDGHFPAEGRNCDTCSKEGHFSKPPLCAKTKPRVDPLKDDWRRKDIHADSNKEVTKRLLS